MYVSKVQKFPIFTFAFSMISTFQLLGSAFGIFKVFFDFRF